MTPRYFIVAAPGYYGDDRTRVLSSHATLAAARREAASCRRLFAFPVVIREGAKRAGEEWFRVYEETYRLVDASS